MKSPICYWIVCCCLPLLVEGQAWKQALTEIEQHYQQQQFHEAIAVGTAKKTMFEQAPDTVRAEYLSKLGVSFASLGDVHQAETYFKAAHTIAKRYPERHAAYMASLNQMGALYIYLLQYNTAEEYLLEAITLIQNHRERYAEGAPSILNNLASTYIGMARYEEAEAYFLEMMNLCQAGTLDWAYAAAGLSTVYMHLNKLDKAEKLQRESIAVSEQLAGKHYLYYPVDLANLAHIYSLQKKYTAALEALDECAQILQQDYKDQVLEYIQILSSRCAIYLELKEYDKALIIVKEIQKTLNQKALYTGMLASQNHQRLAEIHLHQSQLDSALSAIFLSFEYNLQEGQIGTKHIDSLLQALPRLSFYSNENSIASLKTLEQILAAYFERDADARWLERSYRLLETSLQINERIRGEYHQESDKLRILSDQAFFAEKALNRGFQLERLGKNAQFQQTAFALSEQNKSVLLTAALQSNEAQSLGKAPDSLVQRERQLQRELAALKKQLAETADAEEKRQLQSHYNESHLQLIHVEKTLQSDYPDYYQLKQKSQSVAVEALQRLLQKEQVLVEYFIGNDSSYLFLVTNDRYHVLSLRIGRDSVNRQVERLRKQLTDYEYIRQQPEENFRQYSRLAHQLYRELVAPAQAILADKAHWIIVADQQLGHIPFEALLIEAPKQTDMPHFADLDYLIKHHRISYTYSATLLAENAQKPAKPHNGKLLAMAADYPAWAVDSLLRWRRPTTALRRIKLPEIPFTAAELDQLQTAWEGSFWKGADVNERRFKQEASDYAILHFAMHGVLDKHNPTLSSLAFTENLDSAEDNFLQAWEISQLSLRAELVVLSACETGFGKFQQGEGVLSLARSFMYAGVPALVVSQWEVNDGSTAKLMQYFYQYLRQGQDKAQALQQAKLQYLSEAKGQAAHPAFWSAFIQIGDSEALSGGGGRNWWMWGGLAAGLALLGGFWWRRRRG